MTTFARTLNPSVRKFHPTGAKILVLKVPEKEETKGGIILPQNAMQTTARACKVIEVGPKVLDVKKGDTVWIQRQLTFQPIELAGVIHHVIPEEAVLAIT
jgi:co-chaperonin GroES (HSP10)